MTNTETFSIREVRATWLQDLLSAIRDFESSQGGGENITSGQWLFLLEKIRIEGPGLARPDYEGWQRRFRWINLQISRQRNIDWIVVTVIGELARHA